MTGVVKDKWRESEELSQSNRRSWFTGTEERKLRPWYERLVGSILKAGGVPEHVAFIMDGNRRFAKKAQVTRAAGHLAGFETLAEVLELCLDMGIKEVTVYAFSIENFNRSAEEVDCLFDLCRDKFKILLEGRQRELLMQHGVCIRIIGDMSLLPLDLQQMLASVMLETRDNKRAVLNICMAYTARNDIASAVRHCVKAVIEGFLLPSDVNEDVISRAMMTNQMPDLDLLVRTSGEVRLSDFLLWESSHSCLLFDQVLWPEFSIWDLYKAIIYYQRHQPALFKARAESIHQTKNSEYLTDKEEALKLFRSNLPPEGSFSGSLPTENGLNGLMDEIASHRKTRVDSFIQQINNDRKERLEAIVKTMHRDE